MPRQVGQIRYYGVKQGQSGKGKNNFPETITASMLSSGAAFKKVVPIIQLGIQAPPGTKFFVNGTTHPIIIGATGIYELNVEGMSTIQNLQFDLSSLNLINENPNAYLLIDYLYEYEEG